MRLQLKVKKEECTESCPLPLNVLVGMKKNIKKVEYNEEKGTVVIDFNPQKISKEEVLKTIKKMKYDVMEVQ